MHQVQRDLWAYWHRRKTVICITTNGYVKKDGSAVMGRGCAYEATQRIPRIAKMLGRRIRHHGNKVFWFRILGIVTFPVKYNWWEKGDLKLIKKSAKQLRAIMKENPHLRFVLPRPGCYNGRLDWQDVRKVIEPVLKAVEDQYVVVHR